MAVNVSVATDTMSVIPIPVNFDCLGNEMFLYNCSDSGSISCDDASSQTTVVAGAICEDLPGPPSNLTVNSQQSDITLHWEYTDDANNVSNFSVYCKHDKTVNPQLHLNIKTELSLLTKNNSATLIGLLANTVYTCCVSAVFPYMETESTCINVIKGQFCNFNLKYFIFAGYQEAGSSNSSTLSSIPAGNLKSIKLMVSLLCILLQLLQL
ncbi:PREDICTED: uncharacterized protein LOC109592037 [Amphimedon queenslandica]|uniref:Fibronectin type-III domain-containing protein n=1 Tax=Amphimedon queenslandica TaxID=400682 RepID=A0AAN0K1Z9_AMPQE|nr:PREDICTED: uncharacterized protein LOC109592037 [Amphimedon queenslandica]|eukprot:XP_019863171.1 PREDICTED: uncharacterized protein LOC109592037 [Amphimedon queenslandica]